MRTYLVTGGAGFIGSNYIHYMFRKYDNEIRIINVDVLTYAGNLENLKDIENRDNYTFIKADITDSEAISKIFSENDIDRVVHFAAESHVDRSIKNPEVFVKTNVLGTAVMLNCAKAAWELPDGTFKEGKKFLHVSTDEVYGSLEDDGTSYFYETTPYSPHSPYSASKASSDFLVKAYIDTYHFPANITNCSNNYGPYQFPEKLIPLIINNALHGKKLPVYGDGMNIRDWLYVDDHAKGIDMVQEKGRLGETYNIGGHNEKRNIEIINIIIGNIKSIREVPYSKLIRSIECGNIFLIAVKIIKSPDIKIGKTHDIIKNIIIVLVNILLNLFFSFILEMDDVIVKNIKGTIITKSRFKNRSPRGFTTWAFSLNTNPHITPIITIPKSINVPL